MSAVNILKIGVICPSEIAARRFLPALKTIDDAEFIGVAVNSVEERFGDNKPSGEIVRQTLEAEQNKAQRMLEENGGRLFESYISIIESSEIDAIYIPLPPALHYKWAKRALETGKHVLVEKPSTISLQNTKELVEIADCKELALHENYMFILHDQIEAVNSIIRSGAIGDVRLYRISFGFPQRALNDFRYVRAMGGGALLDAGGYTIKYASYLLGDTARVVYAQLNGLPGFEVDMHGSGALVNDDGVTVQIAFGMDNDYKCELEVWGSKGTLSTGRILTAPAGFTPKATISKNGKAEIIELPADDAFRKSILKFWKCIKNPEERKKNYDVLVRQAGLVNSFARMAGIEE